LTDNSIKRIKIFEHKISKKYNQIKNKNIFYVPLLALITMIILNSIHSY
ncbi:hypothetical protein SFB5_283G0, partial [Candidatus Arthromitus sp. SFB-5]